MTVAAVAEVPVTRRLRETPNYLVVVHRNEQNPPGAGRAQPWWFVEGLRGEGQKGKHGYKIPSAPVLYGRLVLHKIYACPDRDAFFLNASTKNATNGEPSNGDQAKPSAKKLAVVKGAKCPAAGLLTKDAPTRLFPVRCSPGAQLRCHLGPAMPCALLCAAGCRTRMPRAGASTFHDPQSAVRCASAKPHLCVFSSTNRNGLDVYVTPPPLFPRHLPSPSVSPPLFSVKQDARAPSAEKTSTFTGQRKCFYSRSWVCACDKEAGGGQRVSKVPCSRGAKRNLASPPCGAPPRPSSAAASGLPCRAPLSALPALGRACPAPGLRLFTTQEALPPSRICACFRAPILTATFMSPVASPAGSPRPCSLSTFPLRPSSRLSFPSNRTPGRRQRKDVDIHRST